jgi:hypothetical protein
MVPIDGEKRGTGIDKSGSVDCEDGEVSMEKEKRLVPLKRKGSGRGDQSDCVDGLRETGLISTTIAIPEPAKLATKERCVLPLIWKSPPSPAHRHQITRNQSNSFFISINGE